MRYGLHFGSIETFFFITAQHYIDMNVLDDNSDACMPFSSSAFMAFLIKSCFFIGVNASCLKVCKKFFYRCVQSFSYIWTTHPIFTANLSKLGEFLGDFHKFQQIHIFMTIQLHPKTLAYLKKLLEFHKFLVLLRQPLPF